MRNRQMKNYSKVLTAILKAKESLNMDGQNTTTVNTVRYKGKDYLAFEFGTGRDEFIVLSTHDGISTRLILAKKKGNKLNPLFSDVNSKKFADGVMRARAASFKKPLNGRRTAAEIKADNTDTANMWLNNDESLYNAMIEYTRRIAAKFPHWTSKDLYNGFRNRYLGSRTPDNTSWKNVNMAELGDMMRELAGVKQGGTLGGKRKGGKKIDTAVCIHFHGRRLTNAQREWQEMQKWGVSYEDSKKIKNLSKAFKRWHTAFCNGDAGYGGEMFGGKDYYGNPIKDGKLYYRSRGGYVMPAQRDGYKQLEKKFENLQKKYPFLILQTDPRGNAIYFGKHDFGQFSV